MADTAERHDGLDGRVTYNFTGSVAVAAVVGGGLVVAANIGAVQLLVAIAAVQTLLAFGWVYGLAVPGRLGALILAGLAAAGADVAVSIWPHGRLGTLVGVFGLAVPLMIVHQLLRGAARVRVIESLGATAVLVLAEIALPALLQLRHEFPSGDTAARVVLACVLAASLGVIVSLLLDLVYAGPRLDEDVPRGLLGVLGAAAAGGAAGYLALHELTQFPGARGAFAGASVGVLTALFAVAVTFVEHTTPLAESGFARRVRPVLVVVVPVCVIAPVAYLLCLAIRR